MNSKKSNILIFENLEELSAVSEGLMFIVEKLLTGAQQFFWSANKLCCSQQRVALNRNLYKWSESTFWIVKHSSPDYFYLKALKWQ